MECPRLSRSAKHAGVRDAVFKSLVHTGRIDTHFGSIYGDLFVATHRADYESLVEVDESKAAQAMEQATEFVTQMKQLVGQQAETRAEQWDLLLP